MHKYISSGKNVTAAGQVILDHTQVVNSINYANNALATLDLESKKFDIDLIDALGMRNLSGLIGEFFVKSVERNSEGKLASNLHQDGYPDLVLNDTQEKKYYYGTLYVERYGRKIPREKEAFSPYKYGGIEVKATCGGIPSGKLKPGIGEQRIESITSFDWKAHHRETNNLLSVLWDFMEGAPTIAACFYCNNLVESDWGKIVQPTEGGGRTTSVSIMNAKGIKKMCEGWIAVIDDNKYITKLADKKWIGRNIKQNPIGI